MVVIGLLAAIAIPTFLGLISRGSDTDAKSNANRVAKMVEGCRVAKTTYRECDEQDELDGAPGVIWGGRSPKEGEVGVRKAQDLSYEVVAVSEAETEGRRHEFVWERLDDGTVLRSCKAGKPPYNDGGCSNGSW